MVAMNDEASRIASYANYRGISRVVHFTRIDNLNGIKENGGLLSRRKITQLWRRSGWDKRSWYGVNDWSRHDGIDYINLSIQRPNIRLFRSMRNRVDSTWVVLELDPSCLQIEGALFTVGNAASRYVENSGVGKGYEGLLSLYAHEVVIGRSGEVRSVRRHGGVPFNCPTCEQAEVLIPDFVPEKFIRDIIVENKQDCEKFARYFGLSSDNLPTINAADF